MRTMVMKSVVRSRLNPTEIGGYEWWAITNPLTSQGSKEVTRERAREIIRANGLVCVEKSVDGEIYDTQDRAFQKEWKGKVLDTKDHREKFDKIWNK